MTFKKQVKPHSLCFLAGVLYLTLTACSGGGKQASIPEGTQTGALLSNDVLIDGSNTVNPISEAMAREFIEDNPQIKIAIGISGTGVGFQKFCVGETDISNASRPIKQSEMELCQKNGIEYVEIPIAFDGISVVVNSANNWTTCLKPKELGKMWEPAAQGAIANWKQIRNGYPDKPLALYGSNRDSGTYDYFTEATVGKVGESRSDYSANEDADLIFQAVRSDDRGLGFLSFAYYQKNKDALKVVAIENAAGECVKPTKETIANGTYNPLGRPIFFYVNKASLEKIPAVKTFAKYQLDAANNYLISKFGYVPLSEDLLLKVQARLDNLTTGSIFQGKSSVGVKLADKL